ncbi:MAG: TIGR03905 family TSCPD domain-containing protein [Bacteroidales bacterium]|jgi:uncharacterized protein (TIGR03905 family)|nr:TIGR03905 family TSCPD domain-containing protein [Bacteroidales bacterium]MCR4558891.1 TIGR03905 family TSCPD domain-containing protein [Bacteroidales bacterium]
MQYSYTTKGTCSKKIVFDKDENGIVTNVRFFGGCPGNLLAISKLVDGMSADKIYEILIGNTCGGKPTSCADQLAIAVKSV